MSDTHCAVCERRIVSSGDGTQWWHWPDPASGASGSLDKHAQEPHPHEAEPPTDPR